MNAYISLSIEPPVGVQIELFEKSATEYFLVVRVNPSFRKPHRYKINDNSRWVIRANKQTVDLTYDQIRTEFDRNAMIAELARKFRDERIQGVFDVPPILSSTGD